MYRSIKAWYNNCNWIIILFHAPLALPLRFRPMGIIYHFAAFIVQYAKFDCRRQAMITQCTICYYRTPEPRPEILRLIPMQRQRELSHLAPDRQKQSMLAEALLRLKLSTISPLAPQDHVIRRARSQKPRCDGFEFSISHTSGAVAVIVSDAPCGADIERLRAPRMGAAKRFFTPGELQYTEAKPELHFWEVWTRKEALAKALGCGLSLDMLEHDTLTQPFKSLIYTRNYAGFTVSAYSNSRPEFKSLTEAELCTLIVQ